MHLCYVTQTLFFVFFLFAKADASANATASPAPPGNFSSTAKQPGTHLSDPPSARDEERAPNIEDFGLGAELGALLIKDKQAVVLPTKDKQAVVDPIVHAHLMPMLQWWRNNGVHPSTVFTNLQLHRAKENSLSNAWFRAWVDYVYSYNADHPGKKVSLFLELWAKFDDYKLAMMLEEAKSEADPFIQALGTILQKQHMAFWRNHKYRPSKVYNRLQSDRSHPILLTGRAYDIWNTYVGPGWSQFRELLYTFGHQGLSSLLIASKQSEKTATLATNLQLELEKEWLSYGKEPEVVFKYLMLDKDPGHVLDNPELTSWMRYAEMYRQTTGKDVTLAQVLVNLFEPDVVKGIIKTANTKDEKELVKNLETMLKEKVAAA